MSVENTKVCKKCGSEDFGFWTSATTGKVHRYCRNCRRNRANLYTYRKGINGGYHTKHEWEYKLTGFDRCPRCGRFWKDIPPRPDTRYRYVWTKDHIIPITSGGSNNIDNLQPLCYQCNSSKCASYEEQPKRN